MEGATVKPEEIEGVKPADIAPLHHFSPEEGSTSTNTSKRPRLASPDDEDDEDGFDPVFEQDSAYVDPSLAPQPSLKPGPRSRTPSNGEPRERKPIQIEYIQDKSRRHITFSKRKAGIMKKAYELSTLTGTQVLLLVVSETGLVYTFTTTKLSPIVNEQHGQSMIEQCLATEEGQMPAFATRDYGAGEPNLTIKRSNGDRSPRRRQVSGSQGRPTTPGSEGRRTSGRHVSHSSQPPMPAAGQAPPVAMPSPRRQPSNPQLPHVSPAAMTVPLPPTTGSEHYDALYGQISATAPVHGMPASIPPFYTQLGGQQDWQH